MTENDTLLLALLILCAAFVLSVAISNYHIASTRKP